MMYGLHTLAREVQIAGWEEARGERFRNAGNVCVWYFFYNYVWLSIGAEERNIEHVITLITLYNIPKSESEREWVIALSNVQTSPDLGEKIIIDVQTLEYVLRK